MNTIDRSTRAMYNKGWQADGSWHCPRCHTMYGKNLLGEKPFSLAWKHFATCTGQVPHYVEKSWGSFPLKVKY